MIVVPAAEAVEAVGEVHAVDRAGDDQEEQQVPERPQRDAPVDHRHEEAVVELLMVRGEADGNGDQREQQHLPAPGQTQRPLVAQLDEVVEEADRAARKRRAEDRQPAQRVVAERQERYGRRHDDQEAAHRRRSLLDRVALGSFRANVLPELVPAQEGDEGRTTEDRDDHCDERGDENAGHQPEKFAATASSPTEREPLSSTTSPGSSAVVSAATAPAGVATQVPP